MHPQDSDKKAACKEFFEALQACHDNPWLRWTGGCNDIKHSLNTCLRKERIDRTERNREHAKVRRKKFEDAREALNRDE